MPKPGERTELDEGIYVTYDRGYIVLDDEEDSIYLTSFAMENFDRWRAELDKDIELRKAAGF